MASAETRMAIRDRWDRVPVAGGIMDAYLADPGTAAPGVVMLQEIFGVNAAMQEKARRFAALGYAVLVPDLFWRLEPRVSLGYTEPDRAKGFELMGRFDFAAGLEDVAAAARWLEASDAVKGGIGVLGFCLGGRLAVAATAQYDFAAVASLYGVKLDADPQRLAAIESPLQVHVGDRDAHVPLESLERIRAALDGRPNASVFVYPGAQHGFFNPVRSEVHDPAAARLAEERVDAMFRASLQ